jgi:hypothetical protein
MTKTLLTMDNLILNRQVQTSLSVRSIDGEGKAAIPSEVFTYRIDPFDLSKRICSRMKGEK